MTKSEDAMSGTTVDQTETRTKSEKGQTRTSSVQEGSGYRVNTRNNISNSTASTNKDHKGEIESFGAVLALKYKKV